MAVIPALSRALQNSFLRGGLLRYLCCRIGAGTIRARWRPAFSLAHHLGLRHRGGGLQVSAVSRVTPGDPDASALVARMQIRGTDDQMPPLATEVVDPTGLGLLRRWIASLAP
ncbi:MAG: hypothetical protein ABJA82_08005 [Myxococcales bacterium]